MAKMTNDELEQATREMTRRATVSRNGITFTSGGRKFTFYWHVRGRALMVKIGKPAHKVQPEIEELAAALRARRVCPTCFKVFPRRGKQAYCDARCSATMRKRRERAKVAEVKRAQQRDALRVQLAQNDELRRKAEKARARRKQRALARKRRELEALEAGHGYDAPAIKRPVARHLGAFHA
jgi:hypothetical protein